MTTGAQRDVAQVTLSSSTNRCHRHLASCSCFLHAGDGTQGPGMLRQVFYHRPTPTPCLFSKASPPQIRRLKATQTGQTDSLRLLISCGVEPSGSTETGVASSGHQNLKAAPCSTASKPGLSTPTEDAVCPLRVRPQHALRRSKENQGLERKWVLRAPAASLPHRLRKGEAGQGTFSSPC